MAQHALPDDADIRIFYEYSLERTKFHVDLVYGSQTGQLPPTERITAISSQLFDHFDEDHDGVWLEAEFTRFCVSFLKQSFLSSFDWMYREEVERVSRTQGKSAEAIDHRVAEIEALVLKAKPTEMPVIDSQDTKSRVAYMIVRTNLMSHGYLNVQFQDQDIDPARPCWQIPDATYMQFASKLRREHFVDSWMATRLFAAHYDMVSQGMVKQLTLEPCETPLSSPPSEVRCFRDFVALQFKRAVNISFTELGVVPYAFSSEECKELLQPVFEHFDADHDGVIDKAAFTSLCRCYLRAIAVYAPHYVRYYFLESLNAAPNVRAVHSLQEWLAKVIKESVQCVLQAVGEIYPCVDTRVPELLEQMNVAENDPITVEIFLTRFAPFQNPYAEEMPEQTLENDVVPSPMLSLLDPVVICAPIEEEEIFDTKPSFQGITAVTKALEDGDLEGFADLRDLLVEHYRLSVWNYIRAHHMYRAFMNHKEVSHGSQEMCAIKHRSLPAYARMLKATNMPSTSEPSEVLQAYVPRWNPYLETIAAFKQLIADTNALLKKLNPSIQPAVPTLQRPPSLLRSRSSMESSLSGAMQSLSLSQSAASAAASTFVPSAESDEKGEVGEEDDGHQSSGSEVVGEGDAEAAASSSSSSSSSENSALPVSIRDHDAEMKKYLTLMFHDETSLAMFGEEGFHSHADQLQETLLNLFAAVDKDQDGLLNSEESNVLTESFNKCLSSVYRRESMRTALQMLRHHNPTALDGSVVELFIASAEVVLGLDDIDNVVAVMTNRIQVEQGDSLSLAIEPDQDGCISKQRILSRWPKFPKALISALVSIIDQSIQSEYSSNTDDAILNYFPFLDLTVETLVEMNSAKAKKASAKFFHQMESMMRPIFSAADQDGDGFLDASDLETVLTQWFAAQRVRLIPIFQHFTKRTMTEAKFPERVINKVMEVLLELKPEVDHLAHEALESSSIHLPKFIAALGTNNNGLINFADFASKFKDAVPNLTNWILEVIREVLVAEREQQLQPSA